MSAELIFAWIVAAAPVTEDQQGCFSSEGAPKVALDLANDTERWAALLGYERPWRAGDLKYTNGSLAVHVWQGHARTWRFVTLSSAGVPLATGATDGKSPVGFWSFNDERGVQRWAIQQDERGGVWRALVSPCGSGSTSTIALVRHRRWEFGCVDAGGRQVGRAEIRNAAGVLLEEGSYIDGKRDGLWVNNYGTGCRLGRYHYREGLLDGAAVEWTQTGALLRRGSYQAGRKTGRWEGAPCGEWRTFDYREDSDVTDRCVP